MSRPATATPGTTASRTRVTFGPYAVTKGAAVSFLLFALGSLVIALWPSAPTGPDELTLSPLGVWLLTLALGFAGSLFLCIPVAIGLGMALRPVTRQALHVLAFFVTFGLLATAPFLATGESDDIGSILILGLVAGALAAIGRASVIKNVYRTENITTPEPAHAH